MTQSGGQVHWLTYYRPHLDAAADRIAALDRARKPRQQLKVLTNAAVAKLRSGLNVRSTSLASLT